MNQVWEQRSRIATWFDETWLSFDLEDMGEIGYADGPVEFAL